MRKYISETTKQRDLLSLEERFDILNIDTVKGIMALFPIQIRAQERTKALMKLCEVFENHSNIKPDPPHPAGKAI